MIGKDRCTIFFINRGIHQFRKVVTIENVIPQHQGTIIVTDEFFANNESLCQAIRAWLDFILQIQTPLASITQKLFKTRCILRSTNN